MKRLTYWNDAAHYWSFNCSVDTAAIKLAAYEETGLTPEEINTLLQKQKDGLIIDLPNVSQADYCLVQSDLNDFINEISYCDKSVGLQGITDNETKIYCAVMDGIKLAAGGIEV